MTVELFTMPRGPRRPARRRRHQGPEVPPCLVLNPEIALTVNQGVTLSQRSTTAGGPLATSRYRR